LGQLFDHGCDAITAWIMGIFIAATVQAGSSFNSFIMLCMLVLPFFAANWEESCTHVFRFGIVGVTEGQFIVMGVQVATGIWGPAMWHRAIFPELLGIKDTLPSLTVFHAVIGLALVGVTYQVVSSVWVVTQYYRAHPEETEGKEQGIVSFVQYFVAIVLDALMVVAPSGVMHDHPRLILVIIGALCSYQASRLIICHTTGEHYSMFWPIMWPLPLLVANEWSGYLLHGDSSQLWFDSTLLLWSYFFYIAALYIHFVLVTIDQITSFLGIRCFHIKHKVDGTPKMADPHALEESPRIISKVFGKAA
jgi:ethanolaminephosphotransferase